MTWKTRLLPALVSCFPAALSAQAVHGRPPVIDVHLHAPMTPGSVDSFGSMLRAGVAQLDSLNVRHVMLTGVPDVLFAWSEVLEEQVGVSPGLLFPCVNGVAVMWGRPCFEDGADWPDMDRLRGDIEAGRVEALGEVTTEFLGVGPSDADLDPYFTLAEEYDLPIFIHMGPGYPGGAYEDTGADLPTPDYRAALGNPLLLEEALLKHPGVRVAVMHSGWPFADEMVSILYHHPQVYAEVGLLQLTSVFPRDEYYAFLGRLVRAGYAQRILFGSDSDLGADGSLGEGISAILEADFLTAGQKQDILCNNAARFLRLDEETCR